MKVEVNAYFQYKSFKIGFSKEFEMQFPPFYDMILVDRKGAATVRSYFSNQGRHSTEIICAPYRGLVQCIVETRVTWDWPLIDVDQLDVIVGAHIDCGWKRIDSIDIESVKQKMREETAMTEAYNAPVGRKA